MRVVLFALLGGVLIGLMAALFFSASPDASLFSMNSVSDADRTNSIISAASPNDDVTDQVVEIGDRDAVECPPYMPPVVTHAGQLPECNMMDGAAFADPSGGPFSTRQGAWKRRRCPLPKTTQLLHQWAYVPPLQARANRNCYTSNDNNDDDDDEEEGPRRDRSVAVLQWAWDGGRCAWPRWDPAEFVQLARSLGGVLFVGDSLMGQLWTSVRALLRGDAGSNTSTTMHSTHLQYRRSWLLVNISDLKPMEPHCAHSPSSCTFFRPVQDDARHVHVPEKYLYALNQTLNHLDWTTVLERVGVLVLNVGHHWAKLRYVRQHRGQDLWGALYQRMISNVLHFVSSQRKQQQQQQQKKRQRRGTSGPIRVVFVAFPGGFPDCDNVEKVLHTGDGVIAVAPNMSSEVARRYAWGAAERAQQAWRNSAAMTTSTSTSTSVTFVDARPALRVRGEAHPHGDCLHWCIPGPLDLVVAQLFAVFRRMAAT